ncbi:MAG: DUF4062 domain-containing protein [Venatoribacter sp.]
MSYSNPSKKINLVYVASNQQGLDLERFEVKQLLARHSFIDVGLPCLKEGKSYDWEVSRRQIELADAFILLLGDTYGAISPAGLGYLHREYVHACSLDKPIFIFVKSILTIESKNTDQKRLIDFHNLLVGKSAYKKWHVRDELLAHIKNMVTANKDGMSAWSNLAIKDKPSNISPVVDDLTKLKLNTKEMLERSRTMINLRLSAKVFESGNLSIDEVLLSLRLDHIFNILQPTFAQCGSEDRLRKTLESFLTQGVKEQLLEKHPKAHAVDDIRLNRLQFQSMLHTWSDIGKIRFDASTLRKHWCLVND